MKRAFIIVPVVIVVLLGLAVVAPGFVDWNKYKPQAVEQIKKSTGYDVALNGNLGMSLLPAPHISIESVEIASPAGSAADHLIRVKRLDVNLALVPLLSGKVDFSSVKLVEPDIALEVFDDGTQNWMTPELKAMTAKDPNAPAPEKNTPAIALRNVSIEKGKFVYRAGKTAVPTEVSDINIDLSADTLQGPFDVDGKITMNGQTIDIDAKTGKLLPESNSVAVNMEASAQPLDASLKYAGVIGMVEPYDVQGETEVTLDGLSEKMKDAPVKLDGDSATIKGLLTGSKDKADFKNATIKVAGNEFKGDISATFSPVKIVASLTGDQSINLDSMIKTGAVKNDPKASTNILPPTIELPASFEADISFALPGLTFHGENYKDVTLKLVKSGSSFTGGFAAGDIPGKGSIDASADLKFASKSISKTGGEVYSDPTMTGTIKGQTQNIGQTMEALSGMKNPALESFKTGAIDGTFSVAPDVMELKSSTLRLGDMTVQIGAAYSPRGARPAVALDLTADTLNFDDLQKKFGGDAKPAGGAGDMQATLQSFSLPYDVDFDVGVQNATLQGQKITGLRAQGTARANALKFTNLSAQDFAGSSFKLSGGVGDLKNLKSIDLNFTGESSDVKGVAKMAGLDPASLPANITTASGSATIAGDISKLAVKASVKALGGELIASGNVGDPLGQLNISGMSVQVKHSNMNQALRIFAPSAPQYASWNKPLDFYAEIDTSGKTHNFKNIKADLSGATLTGTFSLDQSGAKPSMKGDLTFGDLALVTDPNAAAAVSKNTSTAPASTRTTTRWSSDPIDAAWMNAFNADISIKAKSITYETWAFAQPSLSIILRDGALQIKDMKTGLYGGQMALDATMKSNAGKAPLAIEAQTKLANVQVESLVASLARGTRLIQGTGQVSMDANIKTTGSSQQALISSLSGNGTTSGKSIVIQGFDLARFGEALSDENKPKDTLVGLYKTSIKGGSTQFDTMDGNYTINQGVVNISKLDLTGPTANLTTKGNINLPAWTIATDHMITLVQKKDVPPFTIKLAGSLDNPGQTFGQGLLQDYMNRKLTKKLDSVLTDKLGGKAGGVVGALLGVPQQPAATAPAAGDETVAPEATTTTTPAPDAAPAPDAQPLSKKDKQKQAIEGVLNGLLGH